MREQLDTYLSVKLKETFESHKHSFTDLLEIYKRFRSKNRTDQDVNNDALSENMQMKLNAEHLKIVKLQVGII